MSRGVMIVALLCCQMLSSLGFAQAPPNLLRNGDFQNDWFTRLPDNKTLHWCYPDNWVGRRDYNPDAWRLIGSWRWDNADAPRGARRLVLAQPKCEARQSVNWVAVHDDRHPVGVSDAGTFPKIVPQTSRQPLAVVRDLVLRVRITARDVPEDAGQFELALTGTKPVAPPISVAIPPGSYQDKTVELKLSAGDWLAAIEQAAAANKAAEQLSKQGVPLPTNVDVAIRYEAEQGEAILHEAMLTAAAPKTGNLLPGGGFEQLDDQGYPLGWSPPEKWTYFPPRNYYMFTTWHNTHSPDRGPASADDLVANSGRRSLKMIVATGDEKAVISDPIVLNQREPRLIEIHAWVKTDRLNMIQLDAVDERGRRLDGYNFVQKKPYAIGTNGWRLLRQVFRPRHPARSIRLMLCARGVNGFTLEDTSDQPQANVVGTLWWDDVQVFEPESTASELAARGVKPVRVSNPAAALRLENLDFGDQLFGRNVLRASLTSGGPSGRYIIEWELVPPPGSTGQREPSRTFRTGPVSVSPGRPAPVAIEYELTEPCPAYDQYRATLRLIDERRPEEPVAQSTYWLATWTVPIDIELGGLYLPPERREQFVRLNFGLTHNAMRQLERVRLEVIRRRDGTLVAKREIPAGPQAIEAQRGKIPNGLRGDLARLLLADLDVSRLPVLPFSDPQRNWFLRVTALDRAGNPLATADSAPFCRLAHDRPAPAIQKVTIDEDHLLYVNGKSWMPWGVVYGRIPTYAGPTDPGEGNYLDLGNLKGSSPYDRFTTADQTRRDLDFNCLRYVAASITPLDKLQELWQQDNLYCSSAYCVPHAVFSMQQLQEKAGGAAELNAYLDVCRTAPMVVSVAPGIEEAFGLFHGADDQQRKGLAQAIDYVRRRSGKPVMVGHGGFWNRFEFEKAPPFDIYDPETEPHFPANLHTDLMPLIEGRRAAVWLRPQMYESVPYERWRFHTFVELMRGARGWQMAHGPGDRTLFRGLHGELRRVEPYAYSKDLGPAVRVDPWIEHWSRRVGDKQLIIAATTRGFTFGDWTNVQEEGPAGPVPVRVTQAVDLNYDTTGTDFYDVPLIRPGVHGIQWISNARPWPEGTRVVQRVRLDGEAPPRNLALLVKADGRWTHVAAWGQLDLRPFRANLDTAYWFLLTFHRHAKGFLAWDRKLVPKALEYVPAEAAAMGKLPAPGRWVKLEVPLETVSAGGKQIDGVALLHQGGRVLWGHTELVGPDDQRELLWGDSITLPPEQLAQVRIHVDGLKPGTRVEALFEDRQLIAADGHFTDDFRGHDLYQRFGGGFGGGGYGNSPVALHMYELPTK